MRFAKRGRKNNGFSDSHRNCGSFGGVAGMKCENCGKVWHVPSQGNVVYANGKECCSIECAEATHKKEQDNGQKIGHNTKGK